jgi:hypothetical protein
MLIIFAHGGCSGQHGDYATCAVWRLPVATGPQTAFFANSIVERNRGSSPNSNMSGKGNWSSVVKMYLKGIATIVVGIVLFIVILLLIIVLVKLIQG